MRYANVVSGVLLAVVLSGCCAGRCCCRCGGDDGVKISVFASAVNRTAKERGVTPAQAADMLYAAGVRGFDTSATDANLPALAATRLKPANL